ncbi:MAG: outer membrane protein assembly factor BamD [Aquificaceae bacterium]
MYKWLVFLLLLVSCAKLTEERRERLGRSYYQDGMTAYARGDFRAASSNMLEALKLIDTLTPEEIKNARFVLADSFYRSRDFVQAVVYSEDFLVNYPNSPESQRVFANLIDSYFRVAPDSHRDQTYTLKAIEKAREFLLKYPGSDQTDRVLEIVNRAKTKVARHEYLIARFYEDYGYYYSASQRYKTLLTEFPEEIQAQEVLFRYIKSLLLSGEQIKRQKLRLERLIQEAQNSLKDARAEDKEAIQRRIEVLKSEMKRWEEKEKELRQEGLKQMQNYRETFGENSFYRQLLRYAGR